MPSVNSEQTFSLTPNLVGVLLSFLASLVGRLVRGFLGLSVLTCRFLDLSRALVDFAHATSFLVNGSPK